ncbi:MAG: M14 family metallopeptidase [Enterobacterales bacterium]|nr:M14 family metallopeptidase [Enterobacterales bacterium]
MLFLRVVRLALLLLLLAYSSRSLLAEQSLPLSYYLPHSESYDASIPKPETLLGFQVGEWHARPEQIEGYFSELADLSNRVKIERYALSHEKRPLFVVYISSPENIKNLDQIKQQHAKMGPVKGRPLVSWMGYSVHGNEASGSNASMLFAYHLAAAEDEKTLAQLSQQIIIIDPMLNPDGLARFANWANMYRSKNPNSDPNTREHNESWPSGRTNHYWFDLNRDWLLLQHPESQGRIKLFHQWKPNLLTDFHEMGTNSSYFFQPGVESRQNPLTPKENFELTSKIAKFHAKALDKIGSLYYSKESFDDFYYGKGSTYPDLQGAIGILFEQASARGHLQKSNSGEVSFPFAIRNHLTTSLSSIEAAQSLKNTLLNYQRNFYKRAKLDAKSDRHRAIVLSSQDPYRLKELKRILAGHQIKSYDLAHDVQVKGHNFTAKNSLIIPLQQTQYYLIKSLFEERKKFKNNTFYDVSSWNLALAFDIDYQWLGRSDYQPSLLVSSNNRHQLAFEGIDSSAVALAFAWRNFASTELLAFLHRNKIKLRVATKNVKVATQKGYKNLSPGDIILPIKLQSLDLEQLELLLKPKLQSLGIVPLNITSGLAIQGPDIGSPSLPILKPIKPLLLIGEKVNAYQAGEVWHLFDLRLDQDLTMITLTQFSSLAIDQYSHIIMVAGQYVFSEKDSKKLASWIKKGGTLVTQSSASRWLTSLAWTSSTAVSLPEEKNTRAAYAERDKINAEKYIGGAIVKSSIDLTHPLAFGMSDSLLPLFKQGRLAFTEPKEAFVSIARFASKPLIAGYMSRDNQNLIADKSSILVQKMGKGRLILFSEDMNFRGFWLGTSRVFVNALYFSSIIQASEKTNKEEAVLKTDEQ